MPQEEPVLQRISIKDLASNIGPNAILLSKGSEGKYQVDFVGNGLLSIYVQLQNLLLKSSSPKKLEIALNNIRQKLKK